MQAMQDFPSQGALKNRETKSWQHPCVATILHFRNHFLGILPLHGKRVYQHI